MNAKNLIATVAVLAIGGYAAYRLLQLEPAENDDHGHDAHGHGGDEHEDEFPHGPHGGRLLESGGFALEMTIFEDGAPPHFRVYPYVDGEPIAPDEVDLTVKLSRLGGKVDTIPFEPETTYLRGLEVVYEPHSFDVQVEARYGERDIEFDYESHEGRVELSPKAAAFADIEIDTVKPTVIRDVVSLPGEVAMNQNQVVHVVPRISGIVRSVHKNLGEMVERGEVLAVIESRELADAKSEYLAARERRELARSRFEREAELFEKNVSSEDDYLTAKEALAESDIQLRSARQKLGALGLGDEALRRVTEEPDAQLTQYEIRSPLTGAVIEKHITGGEGVAEDADIFLLADLSTVWVKVTVYARDLSKIRPGLPVMVRSDDMEKSTQGVVSYIGPIVGEDTRSAVAIVELPNPEGAWRPGLYVTADIVADEVEVAMAVPVDAIQRFRDFQVVFAKFGDTYEIRMLELGRTDGEWIEVLSGIEPGREYVARNSYLLKADLEKSGAVHDH